MKWQHQCILDLFWNRGANDHLSLFQLTVHRRMLQCSYIGVNNKKWILPAFLKNIRPYVRLQNSLVKHYSFRNAWFVIFLWKQKSNFSNWQNRRNVMCCLTWYRGIKMIWCNLQHVALSRFLHRFLLRALYVMSFCSDTEVSQQYLH